MSDQSPPKRFKAEPVEPKRSSRRFVPMPVETTTKTNRKSAPDLAKTSTQSDRITSKDNMSERKPIRKFDPQPLETTTKSNRGDAENGKDEQDSAATGTTSSKESSAQPQKKQPRKFAPQLMETSRRSRKSFDDSPAVLPSDKTDATMSEPATAESKTKARTAPAPPENSPTNATDRVAQLLDIKPPGSFNSRRTSHGSNRQHSFRVPELDPIESSESGNSSPPSLTTSQSASTDNSQNVRGQGANTRESADSDSSGYLLRLAAEEAEKQLLLQAMAAYPNDDFHEPVDHFVDHEEDDERRHDSGTTGAERREPDKHAASSKKVGRLSEAKQHHHRRAGRQRIAPAKAPKKPSAANRVPSPDAPWANPYPTLESADDADAPHVDAQIKAMRDSARPPMLGGSIVFPRCPSPDPASFDVTQGPHAMRNAMSHLNEQARQADDREGLWCGRSPPEGPGVPPSRRISRSPSAGLWAGCCVKSGDTPPRAERMGLVTPRSPSIDPGSYDAPTPRHPTAPNPHFLPPSPPHSGFDPTTATLDAKLLAAPTTAEDDVCTPAFVTQVYNYLSLGYPALARRFDDELAKIARIPVADLRRDDALAHATGRGYVRLGEDETAAREGVSEDMCVRWKALRLYIREWAKQQPAWPAAVPEERALGGFGVGPRRGSWGW